MLKNLINGQALSRVLNEHARDQVSSLFAKVLEELVSVEVERLIADASLALFAVVFPERKLGREEDAHESSDAPNVTAEAVVFAHKNFWCEVPWGTNLEVSGIVGRLKLYCASKVANFEFGVLCEVGHQDVFDLDVTVDNIEVVKSLYSFSDLSDNFFGVRFCEWLIRLLADVVEKVSSSHQFCHDIVCLVIFEGLNELKHVNAVLLCDFLHDIKFLKDLIISLEGSLNLCFVDNFDGDFDFRMFVLGEDDKAEGTLSELANGLVGVDASLKEALSSEDLVVPVVESLLSLKVD